MYGAKMSRPSAEGGSGGRIERCIRCRATWNVSEGAEIPKSGYLCSFCRRDTYVLRAYRREKGRISDGFSDF